MTAANLAGSSPVITVFSDYGTADGRAAKLVGNILRVEPSLDVCLSQHGFPKGDVPGTASALSNFLAFYPAGTVCVAIVERVGEQARPVAVRTVDDKIFLVPDNGLLTVWEEHFGLAAARLIDGVACPAGENLYAHCAGLLAAGKRTFEELGTEQPLTALHRFSKVEPTVERGRVSCGIQSVVRAFGNLNLTVPIDRFEESGIVPGDTVRIRIDRLGEVLFDAAVRYVRTFGEVPEGDALLYNGSSGYMGMSRNLHSFVKLWLPALACGSDTVEPYTICIEKTDTNGGANE